METTEAAPCLANAWARTEPDNANEAGTTPPPAHLACRSTSFACRHPAPRAPAPVLAACRKKRDTWFDTWSRAGTAPGGDRAEVPGRALKTPSTDREPAMEQEPGICPGCEREGPVGDACGEAVCARRGFAFVPAEYLRRFADGGPGAPDPFVGRMVDDYLVVSVLGAGGFGKVFLALQRPLWKLRAALKRMEIHSDDPEMAARLAQKFEGEAAALAVLNHPNIVRLLKYGVHEGAPFLVMEFVEGARTLQSEVRDCARRGEPMPPERLRHVLRQVLDGLTAAHEQSIVHRDIKPENIMLQRVAGNPDLVRLLDFGLAKFVEERTQTSVAMGTPVYMAPEQLDRRHIGPWTDLYAVGVIAFELFTGRRPFPGSTHQEILGKKIDPRYDPTLALRDLALPEVVLAFLRKALHRDPAERYRSADAFGAGLDDLFATEEATALLSLPGPQLGALLSTGDRGGAVPPLAPPRPAPGPPAAGVDVSGPTGTVSGTVSGTGADTGAPPVQTRGDLSTHDVSRAATPAPRSRWLLPGVGAGVVAAVAIVLLLAFGGRDGEGGGGRGDPGGVRGATVAETAVDVPHAPAPPDVQVARAAPDAGTPSAGQTPLVGAATPPAPEKAERPNLAGIDWVPLPGGTYQRGDATHVRDERPVHTSTVAPFEMARSETTVAQYARCVDAHACDAITKCLTDRPNSLLRRDDHPANCATWDDADAFCRWAGGRLPSGAEWEYAARSGGRDRLYPWGDEQPTCVRAVMSEDGEHGCGRGRTTWPVCSKRAGDTEQGLCDMVGNVWEWGADCWHESYHRAPPDGRPWTADCESEPRRIYRGGGWVNEPKHLRAANRGWFPPDHRGSALGFRCAR